MNCAGSISQTAHCLCANSGITVITFQERQFNLHGFTYAAQLWGDGTGLPIIALHGWLDNCASFDVLMPQLGNVQCLAVDLAGHGFSDHRAGLTDYSIWSEIASIYAIADQMGWKQFALLGHSRGAMMSLLASGVYPDRISHLMMIDALLPQMLTADQSIKRMQASIEELRWRVDRKMSLYTSYDRAITARCHSPFSPLLRPTAELLARRGLRDVDGQFHWHADGKLWARSNVSLSEDVVNAFLGNITAKTLLLLASDGLIKSIQQCPDKLAAHNKAIDKVGMTVERFDDGHFLHMEKAAPLVAKTIRHFLVEELTEEPG